jgi:hypothetical protein
LRGFYELVKITATLLVSGGNIMIVPNGVSEIYVDARRWVVAAATGT